MNFAHDVVDAAPHDRTALVEITRDGRRREWSFGEVSERSSRLAALFEHRGVGRGDIIMTVIGNRPDWVFTLVACFRIGAVALPCNEQLRARDLRIVEFAPELPKTASGQARHLAERTCRVAGIAAGPTRTHVPRSRHRSGPDENVRAA